MNNFDREFEENKDKMYWVIALIVVLAIMAFVASLYEPILRKECCVLYQQAINSLLQAK